MKSGSPLPSLIFAVLVLGAAALLIVAWASRSGGEADDLAAHLDRLEQDGSSGTLGSLRNDLGEITAAIRSLESEVRALESPARPGSASDVDPESEGIGEDSPDDTKEGISTTRTDHPERGTPEWEAQMKEYERQILNARIDDVKDQLSLDENQAVQYRKVLEDEDRQLRDLWSRYQVDGQDRPKGRILDEAAKIRGTRDDKLRKLFGEEGFQKYKQRYPDPESRDEK